MAVKDELLAQLDALIAEGRRLDGSYAMVSMGTRESAIAEVEFQAFAAAARAAVDRISGKGSEFYAGLPTQIPDRIAVLGYGGSVVPVLTGALIALRRAVEAGLLISLENRLRANVYDDFLVQADELLKANYHVAAMVLIGGVLEDHLKKLCIARSLAWSGNGSLSKYNDLLRDHPTAYDTSAWRRIQSIGDDRNKAAHGAGDKVKPDDVADHLQYVHRFLADFPA